MTYTCPACSLGNLLPIKSAYVRHMEGHFVTLPDFPAWRCDFCGYTRYDAGALAQVETLLGPDSDAWPTLLYDRARKLEGPANRGPHRWST